MQRSSARHSRIVGAASALLALFWSITAAAADLAELKKLGLVGERADGYLGLVQDTVPAEVSELVTGINARRRAEYQRIAANNNIALGDVEALAGRKTLDKTAEGGWIYIDVWRQK
ncbi:MAG: YdbL family protein [Pseudomonadota bacterium]